MGLLGRWRNARRRKRELAREVQAARDSGVLEDFGNTLSREINESYMAYWRSCASGPVAGLEILRRATPAILTRSAISRAAALEMSGKFSRELDERNLSIAETAKSLLARLTRPYVNLKRPLTMFGESVLALFDGEMGRLVREQYGSEFTVLWCDCYRATVGRPTASWLWHFDNVPLPALKVLLYLSDTKDTGATTRMLNYEISQALKQRGYLGLTIGDRTADIKAVADAWNIPATVHAPELEAGDALLFHTNCFHQAVTPARGFRDVMTFFVLPSRQPWRQSVGDLLRLEKRPGGFPSQPELIPAWA
jgi:hypothetical protein